MTKFKLYFIALFIIFGGQVFAAPNFPELTGRVVDQVGLLSAERQQEIVQKLSDFEQGSSAQIVVAVIESLEGYEIRDYGIQLARHWEIGQKDKNNGILLLVAPNDRKVVIEVGYGLEGSLTDALSHLIIQEEIVRRFKAGNFERGIEAGVDAILAALSGELTEQSLYDAKSNQNDGLGIVFVVFMIAFVCFIIWGMIFGKKTKRNRNDDDDDDDDNGASGWSWSSGGSGNSSFGGGGFSGGGGSFGGGGASGGW